MFGSKFGQPAFGTSQSVFGAPQQSTSLFGASKPTVSFGQSAQAGTSGLFGQSNAAPTSSLFGGGTSTLFGGTQTGATPASNLFGSTAATTTTATSAFQSGGSSLFSFPSTQATGLGSSLFGTSAAPSGSTGLFGASTGAMGASTAGTAVKFNPLVGQDQILKNSVQTMTNTRHVCITAMKEYEAKSLEELRCEDYLLNRKGPQTQGLAFGAQPTTNLFGSSAPATSSLFGAPATTTATTVAMGLFGGAPSTSGGLFGQSSAAKSLFPAATTTTATGVGGSAFSFGSTVAGGGGLFGASQPSAIGGGLFGAGQTSTLFGAPATTTTQSSLFGGAAPSAAAAPSAFSFNTPSTSTTKNFFGQPTSLFGQAVSSAAPSSGFSFTGASTSSAPLTFGQPAATGGLFGSTAPKSAASTFGVPSQPSGGLFGSTAPAAGSGFGFGTQQPVQTTGLFGQSNVQAVKPFGATSTGLFGQSTFGQQPTSTANQFSFNQPSTGFGAGLFGSQQAKPAGFSLGGTAPTFGTSTVGIGQQPQFATLGTDQSTLAAQQIFLQSHLKGLSQSPYGDTKLLNLLKGRRTTSPHETSTSAAAATTSPSLSLLSPPPPTLLSVKPLPPARQSPRVLTMVVNLNAPEAKDKKLLLSDFENDTLTFTEGYVPKRNIKKLILGRTEDKMKKAAAADLYGEKSVENDQISSSLYRDDHALTSSSKNGPIPLNLDGDTLSTSVNGDNVGRISPALTVTPFRRSLGSGSKTSPLYPMLPTSDQDSAFSDGVGQSDFKTNHNGVVAPRLSLSPVAVTSPPQYPATKSETPEPSASPDLERHRQQAGGGSAPESSASTDGDWISTERQRLWRITGTGPAPESSATATQRHPAGVRLTRPDYYVIPDLDDLAAVVGSSPSSDGRCFVDDGLTVGRRDYGSVYWPGRIEVTGLDLDSLVHFRHKEVTVYPDDQTKPPVGQGLNRKAEITLERVWPNDKTTHLPIKDPKRLGMMRFRERLEKAAAQMGATFIDYRPETGSWVFQVDHFSKYGLIDAEDEEDIAIGDRSEIVDLVQRKHIEVQQPSQTMYDKDMSLTAVLSPGLGGYSYPPIADQAEQSEDVEFLNTEEPSFLVKADYMTSFLGGQDEDIVKLKNHLFYDVSRVERQGKVDSPLRASEFASLVETDVTSIKKIKKHGLMTDLYERSMALLDKKSYERSSKLEPNSFDELDILDASDTKTSLYHVSTIGSSAAGLQLIQPKNRLKSTPYNRSLLFEVNDCYADSSAFNGRRFRVSWTVDNRFLSKFEHQPQTEKPARLTNLFKADADFSACSDFQIRLNQVDVDDGVKSDLLESLLITQQLCSVRYNRPHCSHFIPTNGPESIERYCKALEGDGRNISSESRFFLTVFQLCSALWGTLDDSAIKSQYSEDMKRKENLGAWLQRVCEKPVDNEMALGAKMAKMDNIRSSFTLITINRLADAAEVAFKNGDVRIALCISQLGGPEATKALFRQQLSQWFQSQADQFIDATRLKIYALLAGCIDWKTSTGLLNPFESLDWMRAFGLHLWYCTPTTFTIADCVKSYDSTWTEFDNGLASQPLPPYLIKSEVDDLIIIREKNRPKKKDLRYHLIKLFSERSYQMHTVLNNETWTADPMSQHLSWHLWCVLSACGYNTLTEQRKSWLHVQYAAQLERCGLWNWAIFVLMHISDDFEREKSVKRILSEYVFEASEEQINFLRNDLALPKSWIYEAKALRSRHLGDKIEEASFCVLSQNLNAAHKIFLEYVGPIKVVDDDVDGLRWFLAEFAQHSDSIENWETGGRIYMDFLHLKTKFEEIKQSELIDEDVLSEIRPLVTSLAMRIQYLSCTVPLQRLCQSEMAFLIAQLLRLVLNDDQYVEFSQTNGNLPIPDDYILDEMQRLMDLSIVRIDSKSTFHANQ